MKRYSKPRRLMWRTRHRSRTRNLPLSVADIQRILTAHGFPTGTVDGKMGAQTAAAVRRFQTAFNGGRSNLNWLTIDGVAGPKTQRALLELPHLSQHFTANECWSKGNGDCYVQRQLLRDLEFVRLQVGKPLKLVSVYRDPDHNRKVGGATRSRHLHGDAADISRRYNLLLGRVKRWYKFTGIGYLETSHRVTHVDLRPGDPAAPRTWTYKEKWI